MSGKSVWLAAFLLLVQVTAIRGQNLDELYQTGVETLRNGRALQALANLSAVAAEDPRYRDVQLLLGQCYLMAGLLRPAKQHFERAVEADPDNGFATFFLGFSLLEATRYVEAAEILQRAHQLAPRNPLPLASRAQALIKLGRIDEARDELALASSIAPEEPRVLAALAELELAEGRFESAEGLILRVLSVARDFDHRVLQGRILLESGRADEAVPIFSELVTESPARSDALYLLAQALLRSGRSDEGREALRRFQERKAIQDKIRLLEARLGSSPGDAEARLELTALLLDDGQVGAAMLHVDALRRALPNDPRVAAVVERIEAAM